ncbi:MAG: MFS transporter [Actinobacteria bacterium]|nr:MFS transporter [Actinomycetota bacterium]
MFDNIKNKIKDYTQVVKTYNKIANIAQIIRRYVAINGFDGVITIIGVLIGNFVIGTVSYKQVIIAGSAVCISLTVSGVWSAYNSESAERTKELQELEKSTLHVLDGTVISRAQSFASIILAAVNGISSGITAFIPLIPFFFGSHIPMNISYYLGASLAFLILIGFGLFLGKISNRNLLISIIKMVLAGIFCIALGFLLEFI